MQAEKSVDTPGDRENFISQGFGGDNGKFPFHGVQEAAGSNPVTRTTKKSVTAMVTGFFFFFTPGASHTVSNTFLTPGVSSCQCSGQLVRYGLLPCDIQMTVYVCCHFNVGMSHPLLDVFEGKPGID